MEVWTDEAHAAAINYCARVSAALAEDEHCPKVSMTQVDGALAILYEMWVDGQRYAALARVPDLWLAKVATDEDVAAGVVEMRAIVKASLKDTDGSHDRHRATGRRLLRKKRGLRQVVLTLTQRLIELGGNVIDPPPGEVS